MNERQPYEQLIANKLQQLPVPDADESWQEMKRLLDEDRSPRGAGGKRSGRGRWWGAGVIALVLITGTWVFVENHASSKEGLASLKRISAQNATAAAGNKATPGKESTSGNDSFNNNQTTNAPGNTSTLNNTATASSTSAATANKTIITAHLSRESNGVEAPPAGNSLPVAKDKAETSHSKSKSKDKNNAEKTAGNRYRRNTVPGNGTAAANAVAKKGPGNKKPQHTNGNTIASATRGTHHPVLLSNAPPLKEPEQRPRSTYGLIPSAQSFAINTDIATGDRINGNVDTGHLLNDSTKARMAKAKLPGPVVAKKEKKPFRLNLNLSLPPLNPLSMKSDSDPWWGAGLAFNAPVPIGGQGRYKLNANGSRSLLGDYLPSPYLEFHINQYVYLHTEVNLSAPQFTSPLLAYHSMVETPGSPAIRKETSIYVQKMYYFGWPVSLHYSPFDNFYLSAGIQFNSFQSGLASINRKNYPVGGSATDTSFSTSVVKFKDDSIAVKIAPNEWRWQLGAEYYWNRFTVGVRYNRAFSNMMNLEAASGLPATKARNSAMQLFLRFNIFEGRSKDPNASAPPSSLVRY
ncbi:MAG TPA: hypothetical protein VGM41_13665 [Chitinophagaceae bacterium]|jgi:hypothetical protein